MQHDPMSNTADVAACTVRAVHRRDHEHGLDGGSCHPHVVEVIHLGALAVCVCHDCQSDSGFLPRREAETLAADHRVITREVSVELRSA